MLVSWAASLILLLGYSSKAVRPVLSAPERFLAEYQCTTTAVDSIGRVGLYNSLRLNKYGNPVISYYDESYGILKLATCNDAICSTPKTTEIIYSVGYVGHHTSLQLNKDGYPVIS